MTVCFELTSWTTSISIKIVPIITLLKPIDRRISTSQVIADQPSWQTVSWRTVCALTSTCTWVVGQTLNAVNVRASIHYDCEWSIIVYSILDYPYRAREFNFIGNPHSCKSVCMINDKSLFILEIIRCEGNPTWQGACYSVSQCCCFRSTWTVYVYISCCRSSCVWYFLDKSCCRHSNSVKVSCN